LGIGGNTQGSTFEGNLREYFGEILWGNTLGREKLFCSEGNNLLLGC